MSLFTNEAREKDIYILFRASTVNMGTYIWALAPYNLNDFFSLITMDSLLLFISLGKVN
jgi:hypothetical protein